MNSLGNYFLKKTIVFDENTWRPYCHVRDFSRLIDIVFSAKKSIVDFEVFNSVENKTTTQKNDY